MQCQATNCPPDYAKDYADSSIIYIYIYIYIYTICKYIYIYT